MFLPARKMTKSAESGLDLSFLDVEEANKILEVLERDEQLRSRERERVSKLQSSKRDVKWLHGVTGEWFEDIQRKKFKNDPDVRSLVKRPLTCHLKSKNTRGDSDDSRMSRSKNLHSPKSPASGPSLLGMRSPFASLFSFRKSFKQKPQPPQERNGLFLQANQIPGNTEEKRKFDVYQSTRSVKQTIKLFEMRINRTKEKELASSNAELEKEAFQVLGDLDQKLAQEQRHQVNSIRNSMSYRPRGYSNNGGLRHNMMDTREEANPSLLHDGAQTISLGEGHKTQATYQPRRFHDMYLNRQRTTSNPQPSHRNTFGKSPSLCFTPGSQPTISTPNIGRFSTSSLQIPYLGQNSAEMERTKQYRYRRMPVSSIKWNNPWSGGDIRNNDSGPFRTQSALDLTNIANSSSQNRIHGLYRYGKSHRQPTSNTNVLDRVNYAHNVSNRVFHKNSDNSFGSYKMDIPDETLSTDFLMEDESTWKEENKENTFKSTKLKTEQSVDFPGVKYPEESEPMEIECESEWKVPSTTNIHSVHECEADTFTVNNYNNDQVPCDLQTNTEDNNENSANTECITAADGKTNRHYEAVENGKDSAVESNLSSGDKNIQEHNQLEIFHNDQTRYEAIKVEILEDPFQSGDLKSFPSNEFSRADYNNAEESLLSHAQQDITHSVSFPTGEDVTSQNIGNDLQNTVSNNNLTLHRSKLEILEINNDTNVINGKKTNKYYINGFGSNMLKDQSRNSSSLPDLSNWRSYLSSIRAKNNSLNNSELKLGDVNSSVTQDNKSPSSSANPNKLLLNSNANSEDCTQTTTDVCDKHGGLQSQMLQCLESPVMVSYNITSEQSSQQSMDKGTGSKERADVPVEEIPSNIQTNASNYVNKTSPKLGDVHNESKCCKRGTCGMCEQSAADKNNNTEPIDGQQASIKLCEDDRSTHGDSHSIQLDDDPPWTEDSEHTFVEMSGPLISNDYTSSIKENENINKESTNNNWDQGEPYDTPSKPNMSLSYQEDVMSVTSHKNIDIEKQDLQLGSVKPNINQTLIHDVYKYANTEASQPVNTPTGPLFPIKNILEERLQMHTSSRVLNPSGTLNTYTHLLKEHLLLVPEPFKMITNITEFNTPQWDIPANSEEVRSQITSNESDPMSDTQKVYSYSRIVENTQIYDTSNTNSVLPDANKVEYHKTVSIYYSLPRKFSKHVPYFSQNPVRDVDSTVQISNITSAILENTVNKYPESAKESNSEHPITKQLSHHFTEHINESELILGKNIQSEPLHSTLPLSFLQTAKLTKGGRSLSDEEPISLDYDLVDKFSSLQLSDSHSKQHLKEDPVLGLQFQRNDSIQFDYPSMSKWNSYYTLPNRKTHLRDSGKNVLEEDVANACDKRNIYANSSRTRRISQGSDDLASATEFVNDNLNHSPTFHDNYEKAYNMNNILKRDYMHLKKSSIDEIVTAREKLPSVYRSKSLKDLNEHKMYNTDIDPTSPYKDFSMRPLENNQLHFSKVDQILNRTRSSYCSQYMQNEKKTPKATKKFTYSFDGTDQRDFSNQTFKESFNKSPRISSSPKSPSVFHSVNDNYQAPTYKHGWGSPTSDKHSNMYRSKSMRMLDIEDQDDMSNYNRRDERHFSSKSTGGILSNKSPSTYTDSSNTKYNRRFSAELLIDENDNFQSTVPGYSKKPVYTSKSLDYGIFGKEQQMAFLNNVKKSLTEGRLWRPSFLKNPGFLRKEETYSFSDSQSTSCSPDGIVSHELSPKGSLNIYEDVVTIYSDPDSDTTTDDEYYLDENEKESEL